jgi:hypothetical protein
MADLQESVHVNVEYFDGHGADGDGHSFYVASFVEIAATTDGTTWDELIRNIHEVIDLYMEAQTPNLDVILAQNTRLVITMELPHHAEIA